MATQVIALGTGVILGPAWQGAILVETQLVEGDATAYLRSVQEIAGSIRISLAATTGDDPAVPGPEFTDLFETAVSAFTFSEAGGASVVLKGPNHPDNSVPDATDPYAWIPDNSAAWSAWVNGLGAGEISLTLDDGVQLISQLWRSIHNQSRGGFLEILFPLLLLDQPPSEQATGTDLATALLSCWR